MISDFLGITGLVLFGIFSGRWRVSIWVGWLMIVVLVEERTSFCWGRPDRPDDWHLSGSYGRNESSGLPGLGRDAGMAEIPRFCDGLVRNGSGKLSKAAG